MRRRPRGVLRALLVLSALALLAGGCGADRRGIGQGGFVEGETLSVYMSLPRSLPAARDMIDGAKLALADAQGRAGEWRVNMAVLDDSAEQGRGTDTEKAIANARQALRDFATVAVIGDLDSDTAASTAPLLNAAGILQVTPGAGYPGLTRRGRLSGRGEPQRFVPAGDSERTFVRLVAPDSALAAPMIAATRGARTVAIERDASTAGDALGDALLARARTAGLRPVASSRRADAVIFAGEDAETAAGVFDSVHRENPRALLIGGDALARAGVAQRLDRGARSRLRLVSHAPAVDGSFAGRFRARVDRRPGPYAALGYEAMALVLDGIRRAGDQANIRSVLNETVLSARRSRTLLGDYRIDAAGDTTRRATRVLR